MNSLDLVESGSFKVKRDSVELFAADVIELDILYGQSQEECGSVKMVDYLPIYQAKIKEKYSVELSMTECITLYTQVGKEIELLKKSWLNTES